MATPTTISQRLRSAIGQLKGNIAGCGCWNIGRESELVLIHPTTGRISHTAPEVLAKMKGDKVTYESGTGTVEINFSMGRLEHGSLRDWERELAALLKKIEASSPDNAYPLMTGIPPSLVEDDVSLDRLTPNDRLLQLEQKWLRAADAYQIKHGAMPKLCGYTPKSTAISNAIHACQLHVSLPDDPNKAGKLWNAVMLASPLALSAFVGSPIFLGEPGQTDELRIDVWEILDDLRQGRVFFGPGFVDSVDEVLDYYVDQMPFLHLGEKLDEMSDVDLLRRHVKNMWPWVRLIPDTDHWRIEIRCFAALSPMNETLLSYVTYGLISLFQKKEVRHIVNFDKCQQNFRSAANQGLTAKMQWEGGSQLDANQLLMMLMPDVKRELDELGSPIPNAYYEDFCERLERKETPAKRIRKLRHSLLRKGLSKPDLCAQMTLQMVQMQKAELKLMGF